MGSPRWQGWVALGGPAVLLCGDKARGEIQHCAWAGRETEKQYSPEDGQQHLLLICCTPKKSQSIN